MYILNPPEPLEFEWDERKCLSNLAKHGIDFQDAARVFDGPALEIASNRDGEERRLRRRGGGGAGGRGRLHGPRGAVPDHLGAEGEEV
jgi:hypothetical protein